MPFAESDVRIANLALTRIGENTITSFDEESEPARVMKLLYETVRDEEQEKYNWVFCMSRATLARDSSTPDFEWTYQYLLPADFLRAIEMWSYELDGKFAIEGDLLLTNEETVYLKHIKRKKQTTLFSPAFVKALYLQLGMAASARLTANRARKSDLYAEYQQAIADAASINAIADNLPLSPVENQDNFDWISGREG